MYAQIQEEHAYHTAPALSVRPLVTNGFEVYLPAQVEAVVFALARGIIVRIGRLTCLLAVNAPRLTKRPNAPLPVPLLISLHPDLQQTNDDQFVLCQAWQSVTERICFS